MLMLQTAIDPLVLLYVAVLEMHLEVLLLALIFMNLDAVIFGHECFGMW